ncbi:MAG: TlpA disulfide reductase family protein [Bacillota bacterium]|jgi:thiol-disulfide isomerase/thioredoxin|nr:TlpA disulfide reductase family protein [Bacillota bacterium]NLL26330.1 TlpA family protein disulfide reductase [Erysipelotrichia bacterium]
MNNKKKLFTILLIFALLIGGATVVYKKLSNYASANQLLENQQNQNSDSPQKEKAPDFTVYDASGNEVHLSDFIGKPIVLNFWASWCPPCQMEMPDFEQMYLELGDEIQFLMINMTDGFRETQKRAIDFINENEYSFPVLFDLKSNAASIYGVQNLPTTLFIDAEGNFVAYATGAIDKATLKRGIDMIK